MKILFTVEFYEPHKGGAQEVVKQLAERLSRKGHHVTVATTDLGIRHDKVINGVKVEGFKITGSAVRGIVGGNGEIERYRTFLCGDFDVVVNYATQIWPTDIAFGILEKMHAKKVLISCGYTLYNPTYQQYFNRMPKFLALYDRLVYMSPTYTDQFFHDTFDFKKKSVVIPNGASEGEFLEEDHFCIKEKFHIKTKHLLICISNHYKAKGHAFVLDAFKKMKREDATLLVIGEIPSFGFKKFLHFIFGCYKTCYLHSCFSKNIKILSGKNRELILSAYKSADLFLFGSEIECAPLVMYESFASKTPFITTDVGNVKDYKEYVQIINSPEEMATVANELLNNEDKRNYVATRAFELWQKNNTWEVITDQYEALMNEL